MTSVLTNTGAMTALQVLSQANKNMAVTQGRISTGLKVATADQNAAVYAMAGVMKADVAGYQTIQDNLSIAESGVSVARSAAESIGELLKTMKTKIVSAQDGTVDRKKLQADIDQYKEQIKQIAGSASFNGVNYLKGDDNVDILSSLNRSTTDGASYDVTSSTISFQKQDLVLGEATANKVEYISAGTQAKAATYSVTDVAITFDPSVSNAGTFDIAIGGVKFSTIAADPTAGTTRTAGPMDLVNNDDEFNPGTAPTDTSLSTMAGVIQKNLDQAFGGDGTGSVVTATVQDGKIRITDKLGRGISDVVYVPGGSGKLDGVTEITRGSTKVDAVATEVSYTFESLKGITFRNALPAGGLAANEMVNPFKSVTVTKSDGSAWTAVDLSGLADNSTMTDVATAIETSLNTQAGSSDFTVTWDSNSGKLNIQDAKGRGVSARFDGDGFGKLGGLSTLDVTTDAGAKQALKDIETMTQATLDAAAALGSTQTRLSTQKDFLGKLADALNTGIGTLVDADMTQESARLQSLQVQQQLAAQALAIANQQPQQLLGLFRG
ncbi:flagellin [Benzoatithermus flavus]|uniref:Flagellin n=1 Tax=Benzoatithermus flavus TaxID=3108223 RepID=A0ABU8XVA4_9PROT